VSHSMQILRFAVGATAAAILVVGAAMETHGKVVRQAGAAPEDHGPPGFLRADFDFGQIFPAGYCRPDSAG
jgi:hypothetical protein